jgi:hypothetical protein
VITFTDPRTGQGIEAAALPVAERAEAIQLVYLSASNRSGFRVYHTRESCHESQAGPHIRAVRADLLRRGFRLCAWCLQDQRRG